jgi:pimeloyl-ACP methyl ester carboxylesterase
MPSIAVKSADRELTLGYESFGAGNGDWIVLIRGLGTQLIEWSPTLIEGLTAAGLRVLVFDNRDAGLSDKIDADYRVEDMAADIAGLMDALNIPRAHIFGVSMGGMIAQLFAHAYPERTITLFSVMSSSGNPGLPRAKPEVSAWLSIDADSREEYIRLDAESRVVFGSPGYPESEADRIEMSTRTYDRSFVPEGTARQMRAIMASMDRVKKLAAIQVPTLVIHGEEDALLPLPHGEDTAQRIPGARFTAVAGMGHNIPHALAPLIVDLVTAFVADVSAGH